MNYLSDLVSDHVYSRLMETGMLSAAKLRNYYIRRRFRELKAQNIASSAAIQTICRELPWCSPELVRQKVYTRKL